MHMYLSIAEYMYLTHFPWIINAHHDSACVISTTIVDVLIHTLAMCATNSPNGLNNSRRTTSLVIMSVVLSTKNWHHPKTPRLQVSDYDYY